MAIVPPAGFAAALRFDDAFAAAASSSSSLSSSSLSVSTVTGFV
jgi:hypothetical protein